MLTRTVTALLAAVILLPMTVVTLPAIVLNFDDLSAQQYGAVPAGYGGIDWDYIDNPYSSSQSEDTFWQVMTYDEEYSWWPQKSAPCYLTNWNYPQVLGFNVSGTVNSLGAWFANGGTDSNSDRWLMQLVGYVGETPTYYSDVLNFSNDPAYLSLKGSLVGLTRVEVTTPYVTKFRMDDLTINEGNGPQNPVPEPSTLLLLGTGLSGLGLGAIRKYKKS